jgi:hypothetical protein
MLVGNCIRARRNVDGQDAGRRRGSGNRLIFPASLAASKHETGAMRTKTDARTSPHSSIAFRRQGNRIKIAIILNGAPAGVKAAGRCAVKNPVEDLNSVRSCPKILLQTPGIAPPSPSRRSTQDDLTFLMRLP